jgi:branched-chain amino acid aminotransferase
VREICEREGIPFELRKIRPEELSEASEVFTSTTAGGVMPVTGINGTPVGNGHAGIVTSRIQSTYWSEREAGWHGVRAGDILAN